MNRVTRSHTTTELDESLLDGDHSKRSNEKRKKKTIPKATSILNNDI